jgi:uncharacterized protein
VIDLARVIELTAAPQDVWDTLWDIPRLARCIPGCDDVQEVEPGRRYRATVRERVGPFKVAIPLDIRIEASEAPTRLAVTASGRDSMLASPVKVSMSVALAPGGGGTSLALMGKAEVGGKLAALGQGVIQRKTRDVLDQFATNLGALLRGEPGARAV